MSILQLSRITHRKGLQENLPQLAGAELGWSLDERRLFIGNGTIEDGAPVIGNTEILTEFSDILALTSTYTYKGSRAGYVVSTGENQTDIIRSLQDKFDETVSVLDFGAVGDGVTDDSEAINRAFYQLFCREANTEIRRALYFPAGTYVVNDTILIPPHAKCYGDGITSSIIKYINPELTNPPVDYVAETSDSLNQTGVNIGNNGAQTPTGVEMFSMSIESTSKNSILLLNGLTKSSFSFMNLSAAMLPIAGELLPPFAGDLTAAIKFISSNALISSDITFNKCLTSGTTFGIDAQDSTKGIQFENGKINLHFKGVNLGTTPINGGPSGFGVSRCIFDNIANSGIEVGACRLNSSSFNVFYDVGNNFGGAPAAPVINFHNEGNVSIGDLFDRNEDDNIIQPRIALNGTSCIAFDSTSAIKLGAYERRTGLEFTLSNNTNSGFIFKILSPGAATSFQVDYTIARNGEIRQGTIIAQNDGVSGTITYNDEYNQSADTGVELDVIPDITNDANSELRYTLGVGTDAIFKYSIVRLD